MIILGVVGVVYFVYLTIHLIRTLPYLDTMVDFLMVFFSSSLVIFFLGLFLFTKKRWAWWLGVAMLVLILIVIRPSTEFSVTISLLTEFSAPEWASTILLMVPLALLLLDRKNFWEVSQKTLFPIKTRIIAILILVINGFRLTQVIYSLSSKSVSPDWSSLLLLYAGFYIIFFIAGLLILLKKRFGWWLAIIIFSIITIFLILVQELDDLFISIVPLIVLLLDRKNFFKIAS